jgi:hypothetical protein
MYSFGKTSEAGHPFLRTALMVGAVPTGNGISDQAAIEFLRKAAATLRLSVLTYVNFYR